MSRYKESDNQGSLLKEVDNSFEVNIQIKEKNEGPSKEKSHESLFEDQSKVNVLNISG